MANIQSAEKKNRQRAKRQARNNGQKSAMRTAVKKLRAAITAKKTKEARALLHPALRLIDRLGRRGVIKPRAASRAVSRLTVAVNHLGGK
jgi:small subunit ribosomal protein S20